MKPILFTIVLFNLLTIASIAQTPYVSYGYDPSGNRISRIIAYDTSPLNAKILQNSGDTSALHKTDSLAQMLQQKPYVELLGSQQITIFPNPTKGQLVVSLTNLQEIKSGSLSLFDINGREVYNMVHISGTNAINFSNEPSGMYGLRIVLDGKATEWKVIKQ